MRFRRKKLEDGLEKTRTGFFQSIVNTLTNAEIDDDLYNDLEEQLILADVGPATAVRLVDELRDKVQPTTSRPANRPSRRCGRSSAWKFPRMTRWTSPATRRSSWSSASTASAKTTTIAKLAYLYKDLGKRVMLAAGDTFRAAASEQLETWARARRGAAGQGGRRLRPPRPSSSTPCRAPPPAITTSSLPTRPAACTQKRPDGRAFQDRPQRQKGQPGSQPRSPARARRHHRPERHQPGAGILPRRRGHRRCADQARRHAQGRLHPGRARKARPAHPALSAWAKNSTTCCSSRPPTSPKPCCPRLPKKEEEA